jgi:hypothetical protein
LVAAVRAVGTGTASSLPEWLMRLGNAVAVLMPAAWIVGQIRRYRRHSTPVERLQTRWVLFGFGLVVIGAFGANILGALNARSPWVAAALITAAVGTFTFVLPVAAGVAVLRYRLYEIDRIISRTVTYTLLATLLAGIYAAIVFGLTLLVPAGGDLAVAASTLAVAGLFNPLRLRIHHLVERRFNRHRYDAEQLINSFNARLRSGINLGEVVAELKAVLARTVEPSSTMIWVRGSLG